HSRDSSAVIALTCVSTRSSASAARSHLYVAAVSAPAVTIRERSVSSRRRRSSASPIATESSTATTRQFSPFRAYWLLPPLSVTTTALPHAIASSAGRPRPSTRLGRRNTASSR